MKRKLIDNKRKVEARIRKKNFPSWIRKLNNSIERDIQKVLDARYF